MGRNGICHMDGRERQKEKLKGGEEEGEKGETQRPTSTHLMLPVGPGDADSTVLLIHSPTPTCSPSFAVSLYSGCPCDALFLILPDLSHCPVV